MESMTVQQFSSFKNSYLTAEVSVKEDVCVSRQESVGAVISGSYAEESMGTHPRTTCVEESSGEIYFSDVYLWVRKLSHQLSFGREPSY